jgi:hypothetical protein
MMNTTTMLAHIKGSARDFLYPFQDKKEAQKVRYEGEISWGGVIHDYYRQPSSQVSPNG